MSRNRQSALAFRQQAAAPPGPEAVSQDAAAPRGPGVRRHGWTTEKQALFLKLLAQTGSVEQAAVRVGMSTSSAYRLRQHPSAAAFRDGWSKAVTFCIVAARDQAFERALNGQEQAYIRDGEIKGRRRVWNDRLIMFLLKHYDYRVNDYDAPGIEERFVKQLDGLVDLPLIGDERIDFDD